MGGAFEDVTDLLVGDWFERRNVANTVWADVDNDGDLDLYCAILAGPDRLLIQGENGMFSVAEDRGIPEAPDVRGVNFVDIDNDGDLDLYVTEGRLAAFAPIFPPAAPGIEGAPNHLLLNDGTGNFTDVTEQWQATAGASSETFGAVFFDFDRDGDQDGFVFRDFRAEHILVNTGSTFSVNPTGVISTEDTSFMGTAIGDVNGDGHLDIYATDWFHDWLYLGTGDGRFEAAWLDAWSPEVDPTPSLVGWGVVLLDADNDGDQDVVNVAAYDKPGGQFEDSPGVVGGFVALENTGARFEDVTESAGLTWIVHGFSMATADFDLDGDPDLAVGLEQRPDVSFGPDPSEVPTGLQILRNESARAAGNRPLEVSLRAPGEPNAWAVGAIVDVEAGGKRTSRVVTAGDSHKAAHSFVQHFGLGVASEAEVTVTWPDGRVTRAHSVPSGYARMAPHDGDCCWADADCDAPWVECPIWAPPGDPCGGRECDVCALMCEGLVACGAVETDQVCRTDCAGATSLDLELVNCLLGADCAAMAVCLQ